MAEHRIYHERITSNRTTALFAMLALVLLVLCAWRVSVTGVDVLAVVLFIFFCFFAFYSINYRALIIELTPESLVLSFGVFTWTTPADNIAGCGLDELPALMRYGGAGIHFMTVRGRYRVSLNFLEHPRVVVALKKPRGPVRDISFSTRRPDDVLRLIGAVAEKQSEHTEATP